MNENKNTYYVILTALFLFVFIYSFSTLNGILRTMIQDNRIIHKSILLESGKYFETKEGEIFEKE